MFTTYVINLFHVLIFSPIILCSKPPILILCSSKTSFETGQTNHTSIIIIFSFILRNITFDNDLY